MKLCAIQIPFASATDNAGKSAEMLVDMLNSCDQSCDIILTPEYSNAPSSFQRGECIVFAAKHTDELISAARNAAKRCNAIVAVNYVCETSRGIFRNTTGIFDRQGNCAGKFFKQHLPEAEKNINLIDAEYTRSFRKPEIIEIDGIRFGSLICYDTYFSEYVSHLAMHHPDIVLVSSFQRAEKHHIIKMQNQHLAFNCNCFVLRSSVSMGESSTVGGNSMAVAPDGTVIGEFGNKCGVFECNIDDIKSKHMRSNSFGGKLIANDRFIEQGRTTWAYRPCGSMTVESDSAMPYPRICAHRGFNTAAPENSLAAFGAAIALGAGEIEFDVRFSADGIPVVSHDSTLERVSNGRGLIEEHSFEELRKLDFGIKAGERFANMPIASFEEVLSKFARHAVFNLHLKNPGDDLYAPYPEKLMKQIVSMLRDFDQDGHTYFMGAFGVMETAKKVAPDICRCMGAYPEPWEIINNAIKFDCRKVQLFKPFWNEEMIEKAHAHNIRCNFFYSDDPEETAMLLAAGVDTVLTNDYWNVSRAAVE